MNAVDLMPIALAVVALVSVLCNVGMAVALLWAWRSSSIGWASAVAAAARGEDSVGTAPATMEAPVPLAPLPAPPPPAPVPRATATVLPMQPSPKRKTFIDRGRGDTHTMPEDLRIRVNEWMEDTGARHLDMTLGQPKGMDSELFLSVLHWSTAIVESNQVTR